MTIQLTNQAGVPCSLSNEFLPNLKWELEDQPDSLSRLECVNRNAKYNHRYEVEYSSKTKEVYKHIDSLGNIDYLIVRF